MHLRRRTPPKPVAGAFSERADHAASAGVKGGSEAAEEASGNAGDEGEREQTKAEGSAQGARPPSCGRNAISARLAGGAMATPRTPPAKARRTLSARSWRPIGHAKPRERGVYRSRVLVQIRARGTGRRRSGTRGRAERRSRQTGVQAAGKGCGVAANGPGARR